MRVQVQSALQPMHSTELGDVMARSPIATVTTDLQSDSGSVLWSLVQGEQLEFPVTLNFLSLADSSYAYEAVVMEAANVLGDATIPTLARPSGVNTKLVVRVPSYQGTYNAATTYAREDVVLLSSVYYKSISAGNINHTPPNSTYWDVYVPNKVYIQFPEQLSLTYSAHSPSLAAWTVQPTSVSPVYGFFELRITEPGGGIYTRTWKPMRGLVELLYSPTALVS